VEKHIHFLIFGESRSLESLQESQLASTRLRVYPCFKAMVSHGWRVSAGDSICGNPKIILVTKIGSDNIENRSKQWLKQINAHKSQGTQIVLDYSDHHLGYKTTLSNFYDLVVKYVDKAIVPSKVMRNSLFHFLKKPIVIVEDPVEFPIQPVKLVNKPITFLWFGHATNIKYLIQFLETGFQVGDALRLIILSNQEGLNIFLNSIKKSHAKIDCQIGIWSQKTMLFAASKADACIIPSDPTDIKKNGASSNRLLTAFALGLPVAADHLESYIPYSDFYVDLRSTEFRNFLDNPADFHERTISAQKIIASKFTFHQSETAWFNALT